MRPIFSVARVAALSLLLLFLGATFADAQSVDSSAIQRQSVLRDAARQNWYVRASGRDNVVSGRMRALEGDTAVIGAQRMAHTDIAELARRTNVGGGWKVGALIGSGGLAAGGYALAGMCESSCGGARLGATVAGAVVGALLGGVIGQAIVPAKHEWHTIWP